MKDEVLTEIREIRRNIALEFDHDISRYVAYLQRQKEAYFAQIRDAERMLATPEVYSENVPLQKAA